MYRRRCCLCRCCSRCCMRLVVLLLGATYTLLCQQRRTQRPMRVQGHQILTTLDGRQVNARRIPHEAKRLGAAGCNPIVLHLFGRGDRRSRPCCVPSTLRLAAPTSPAPPLDPPRSTPHSCPWAPGHVEPRKRLEGSVPLAVYAPLFLALFVSLHFTTPRLHTHRDSSSRFPAQTRRTSPGHHRHVRVPAEPATPAHYKCKSGY
jgi:hypothetical protein